MNKMHEMNNKVMILWRKILWSMDNADENYSGHDKQWLSRSIALVILFFDEADKRRKAGIEDSAKKIIEDLRSSTKVGDCSKRFQIDNTGTSLLAHVYNDTIQAEYFFRKSRDPFGPHSID